MDAPTNELHTDAFVERVRAVLPGGVDLEMWRGQELADRGWGHLQRENLIWCLLLIFLSVSEGYSVSEKQPCMPRHLSF